MAKLSARKRTEVFRVRKDVPDSDYFIEGKITLALMSDGKILEKRDAKFKPDNIYPKGRPHTWGWKIKGKIKSTTTPEELKEFYLRNGYQEVTK